MSDVQPSVLSELWKTQRALMVVILGAFCYFLFFSVISILRYEAFSFTDFDFAVFVHTYWKILHGSAQLSILKDIPIWGNTLELICYVTAPIFWLSGMDPRSLLLGQSFILGAGAIPVFLIARQRLSPQISVCMAYSYLLYPAVWYCNLYEYYPIVYATFTLLMAFYYLEKDRFGWFMVFILLSLVNRADLGIVTAMYGVYAFAQRRPWKWVLWPIVVSGVWVVVGLFIIIPRFNHNIFHASYYSQFGHGFGEIFKNMIMHPELLWKDLITLLNAKYLFEMLYPLGFLSLIGIKEFLICTLSLLQHLASNRASEHTIFYHYTATITPFVYISAIHGMAWLVGKRKVTIALCSLPLVLSAFANLSYGPLANRQDYIAQLQRDDEDVYKKKMVNEIPKDAPVTSTFEFSSMLAGRQRFYSFHYIYNGFFLDKKPFETPSDIQYALINVEDPRMLSFRRENSDENFRKFIADGPFGIVDRVNNVLLLEKHYHGPMKVYDVIATDSQSSPIYFIGSSLELLHMDHAIVQRHGQSLLQTSYHWRSSKAIEDEIMIVMSIKDKSENVVHVNMRQVAYGIYPVDRWRPGEGLIEYYDMLLPSNLKKGEYSVFLSVFSQRYQKLYKIFKDNPDQANATGTKETLVYRFQVR